MVNKGIIFNKEKFKQVLHYIISKTGCFPNVGKTVLFKMLYFSDFDYYEINEEPITGEVYIKLPQGPAPKHFNEILEELKSEKKVKEFKRNIGKHKENLIKFVSLIEPIIDKLNIKEKEQIDNVLQKLSAMNATQVSGYSHEDIPWKATEDKKEIDYEFVFYRDETYSVRNKEQELIN